MKRGGRIDREKLEVKEDKDEEEHEEDNEDEDQEENQRAGDKELEGEVKQAAY